MGEDFAGVGGGKKEEAGNGDDEDEDGYSTMSLDDIEKECTLFAVGKEHFLGVVRESCYMIGTEDMNAAVV